MTVQTPVLLDANLTGSRFISHFEPCLQTTLTFFHRSPGASLTLTTPQRRVTFGNPGAAPFLTDLQVTQEQVTVFCRDLNSRVLLTTCHPGNTPQQVWAWLVRYQEWAIAPRPEPAFSPPASGNPDAVIISLQDALRDLRDHLVLQGIKCPSDLITRAEATLAHASNYFAVTQPRPAHFSTITRK